MEVVSKCRAMYHTTSGVWVMRLIIVLMVVAFPLRKEKSENGDTSVGGTRRNCPVSP